LLFLRPGNATLALGMTTTATANLEVSYNMLVRGAPLFLSYQYQTTSGGSVTLNAGAIFDEINFYYNVTGNIAPFASTLNMILGVPTGSNHVITAGTGRDSYLYGSATPNRRVTLRIFYRNAVMPTRVAVRFLVPAASWSASNSSSANFEEIPILWSGGEAPVFSRVTGNVDVVHFYWTGRGWPSASSRGTCYGIASIGFN
jgi:hypothetical protein